MKTKINLATVVALLAITGMSQANLISITDLSGNATVTATAGSIVHLQLEYSGQPITMFDATVIAPNAIIQSAAITARNRNSSLDVVLDPYNGVAVWPITMVELAGAQDIDIWGLTAGQMATLDVQYNGGTLVLMPALYCVTNLQWTDITDTVATAGVIITPEPATLLLLGLGGMMIRKFKSKN